MKAFCGLIVCLSATLAHAGLPEKPTFTLKKFTCPFVVSAGDVNNDSNTDLIVSSWFPIAKNRYDKTKARVFVFHQKNRSFARPADREIHVNSPWATTVGDFDGDGKNDLAVSETKNLLHVYLGKEKFEVDHKNYHSGHRVRSLDWGHLSRGGVADFLCGPIWRKWYSGKKFRASRFYGPKSLDNGVSKIADVNCDGIDDVVFTSHNNQLRVYYGPFTTMKVKAEEAAEFLAIDVPLKGLYSMAVADLNDDGRLDLVASGKDIQNAKLKKTCIYFQDAPIGFHRDAKPSVTISGAGYKLAAGRFNDDDLNDLAIAAVAGHIHILLQRKDKPFPTDVKNADTILKRRTYSMTAADINGDGLTDLIATDGRGTVSGYVNQP